MFQEVQPGDQILIERRLQEDVIVAKDLVRRFASGTFSERDKIYYHTQRLICSSCGEIVCKGDDREGHIDVHLGSCDDYVGIETVFDMDIKFTTSTAGTILSVLVKGDLLACEMLSISNK